MATSTLITGLALPAPFLEAFREAMERLGDGPLSPAIDLFTTADAVIAKVALPGVKREDVDVAVGSDLVTIRGERTSEPEPASVHRIHRELGHGPFSRSFWLPTAVDGDGAVATLRDGLLTLILPKARAPRRTLAKVSVS